MAAILGPGVRKALETRRSPLKPGQMVCLGCSAGQREYVVVRKCRVYSGGLMRPGVRCPKCHLAWMEQEEQPEKVR